MSLFSRPRVNLRQPSALALEYAQKIGLKEQGEVGYGSAYVPNAIKAILPMTRAKLANNQAAIAMRRELQFGGASSGVFQGLQEESDAEAGLAIGSATLQAESENEARKIQAQSEWRRVLAERDSALNQFTIAREQMELQAELSGGPLDTLFQGLTTAALFL